MGTPRTFGGFFLPDSLKVLHAKRPAYAEKSDNIQTVRAVPSSVRNKLFKRSSQPLDLELSNTHRWRTERDCLTSFHLNTDKFFSIQHNEIQFTETCADVFHDGHKSFRAKVSQGSRFTLCADPFSP